MLTPDLAPQSLCPGNSRYPGADWAVNRRPTETSAWTGNEDASRWKHLALSHRSQHLETRGRVGRGDLSAMTNEDTGLAGEFHSQAALGAGRFEDHC